MVSLNTIPHAAWPLGAGLFLTSGVFFGNVGLALAGAVPIAREKLGPAELSEKQRVRIWRLFFDAAAPWVIGSVFAIAILDLSALYFPHTQDIRTAAYISAGASVGVLPYTRVLIIPIVRKLQALDAKPAAEWTPGDKKASMEDMDLWNALHLVRIVSFGVAWVAGVYALLGTLAAAGGR